MAACGTAAWAVQQQEPVPDNPVTQGVRRPRFANINGQVFVAEGRQLEEPVEVRLLEDNGLVRDYAYTFGSGDFKFESVPTDGLYYIEIELEGFEPIRERVDATNIALGSSLTFVLRPAAEEPTELDAPADRVVDVRRLQAEIPDEARRLYERSRRETDDGEHQTALELLEAALDLAPDYFEALNNLGGQYLRFGRYAEAELTLLRAHELEPNSPAPLLNLGALYSAGGDSLNRAGQIEAAEASYAKAVQALAQATLLDPSSAETSAYLGVALYRTGDFGAAEQLLSRALEIDRELHDARLSLVSVYARLGNLEAAREQAAIFEEMHPDSPQLSVLDDILGGMEDEIDR
jgi:Flp pilus assembly protein TadD